MKLRMHIMARMRPANRVIELKRDDPECISDYFVLVIPILVAFK